MSLYLILAPTRSRQILEENGWAETIVVQHDEHCFCASISGHLTSESIVALLPAIASRRHVDARLVRELQLLCTDLNLRATVSGEVTRKESRIDVTVEGGESRLSAILCDDLQVLCHLIFTDASIISDMTGSQYEGINIFERQTRNYWVFGEAWYDLPPLMRPDLEQQQLWLSEILDHDAGVVPVGLSIFRDFDMFREGDRFAGICIIRPGAPVRHWLPLSELHVLADEVRQRIILERELTASFS